MDTGGVFCRLSALRHYSPFPSTPTMAVKTKTSDEKQKALSGAVAAYHAQQKSIKLGERVSVLGIAREYGVAESTLRGRLQGAKPAKEVHQDNLKLTQAQEESIVRFCQLLDDLGFPVKLGYAKKMAEALLARASGGEKISLGAHWLRRFLARHPGLQSKVATWIDRQRAAANDPEAFKEFFRRVSWHVLALGTHTNCASS